MSAVSVVVGKANILSAQRNNLEQFKAEMSLSLDVISTDRDSTKNREGVKKMARFGKMRLIRAPFVKNMFCSNLDSLQLLNVSFIARYK